MKIKLIILLTLATLFITLNSCKYDLIQEPTKNSNAKKNAADYADEILPPKQVEATNGLYKRIKISWTPVENAVDYALYSAETPFNEFSQIAETANTEYEIETTPGTNLYFAVSAINYYGTESFKSKVISGSSLATPIITEIENNTPSSFTVKWWMDNCDSSTYENNTKFIIRVYDKDKRQLPDYTKTVDGKQRSVTIEHLPSSTKFWFTVEAEVKVYNKDGSEEQTKNEISDFTDKESAHKITPDKVSNFTVTKGSDKQIKLNFEIPDLVWAKENDIWDTKPVFFSILRKDLDSEEEFDIAKHQIATIGSLPEESFSNYTTNAQYHFDCKTNKVFKDKTEIDFISIESATQEDSSSLKSYVPMSKVTFIDNTALRGKQYSYIVRSFPDFSANAREHSDETSVTKPVIGWAISQPSLVVKEEYIKNNDIVSNIKVTFADSTFNTLNTKYKYAIARVKTEIEPEIVDKVFYTNDFKSFEDTITATTTAEYYKYTLYILPEDAVESETVPENPLDSYSSNKVVTVIDDFSKLPVLENFTVDDGYTNKFVINCDAQPGVEYKLIGIPVVNGIEGTQKSATITFTDNKCNFTSFSDSTVIAENQAYKFILRAKLGEISKEIALEDLYYTLGKPAVAFNTYEYDSITVTWPKVQMASNNYQVSAEYANSTCEEDTGELTTPANTSITFDDSKNLYTCTITKPSGFNKSYISGRPINLKVKATSAKHEAETSTTNTVVRTLGPAEMTVSAASQTKKNQTSIKWTPAAGAKKYLIYRIMYGDKDMSDNKIIGTDKLIIDAKTLSVENDSDQENKGRTICEYNSENNYYTLIDKQIDATETYGYQFNQERIQWGYPIDYVVLPMRENDNANTILFNYINEETIFDTKSAIAYEKDFIKKHKIERHTFGYGFNVHAAKSESGSKIKVTWEKPNNEEQYPTIFRMPFNSENEYGAVWGNPVTLSPNTTEYFDTIPSDKSHKAFVYAVQYDTTSDFVKSYRKSENALGQKDNTYDERYSAAAKPVEPSNKGYLFSITDVAAQPIEMNSNKELSYTELLSWNTTWDFTERALCPKSFYIEMKNKNLSYTKDWIKLAKVDITPTGDFIFDKTFEISSNDSYKTYNYDIDIDNSVSGKLAIEPKSFKETQSPLETNGLLKVSRDLHHYYRLNITNDMTNYHPQFGDESLYTYRNLTDTELTKCVSLIIADALYQCSIPTVKTGDLFTKNWGSNFLDGYFGKLTISHYGGVGSNDLCRWTFGENYIHNYISGTPTDTQKSIKSNLSISSTLSNSATGIKDYKLYYLPEIEITINQITEGFSDNKLLQTLNNRKIKFEAGESGTKDAKYTLKIYLDNVLMSKSKTDSTKPISKYEEFILWFPYNFNNDMSANPITKYTESAGSNKETPPIYNSTWWN